MIWFGHRPFVKDEDQLSGKGKYGEIQDWRLVSGEQGCSTLGFYFYMKWFPDLCVPGLGQICATNPFTCGKTVLILTTFAAVTQKWVGENCSLQHYMSQYWAELWCLVFGARRGWSTQANWNPNWNLVSCDHLGLFWIHLLASKIFFADRSTQRQYGLLWTRTPMRNPVQQYKHILSLHIAADNIKRTKVTFWFSEVGL